MHHFARTARRCAVALTALIALLAAPSGASASLPDLYTTCLAQQARGEAVRCVRTASLTYKGWTWLNLTHCSNNAVSCAYKVARPLPAWRWNGQVWKTSSLNAGWVYVYPYTGTWRWAWTSQTGWVAVTGGRFELVGQ